jgi:hypothetical protein
MLHGDGLHDGLRVCEIEGVEGDGAAISCELSSGFATIFMNNPG